MSKQLRPHQWKISHYAVTQLVAASLEKQGIRWDELALRLPYKDFNNALCNLDSLAREGVCVKKLRNALPSLLDFSKEELAQSITETEAQKKDEFNTAEREAFVPCIRVIHLSVRIIKCPLFMLSFTLGGAVTPLRLPDDIARIPITERMGIICSLVRAHYEKYANNAGIELLKGIKGYYCELQYGEPGICVDFNGNIIEWEREWTYFTNGPSVTLKNGKSISLTLS